MEQPFGAFFDEHGGPEQHDGEDRRGDQWQLDDTEA
jgi:hypothetical protein